MQELAQHYSGRVQRAKVILYGGAILERRLRTQYRDHKIELLASHDQLLVDVEANYGPFTLLFVNPRPRRAWTGRDPTCNLNTPGKQHRLFTHGGELSNDQSKLVQSGALKRLLEAISPHADEEINISQRLVRVYLNRPSAVRVRCVIEAVIDHMPHELAKRASIHSDAVPAGLQPLLPLVAKWAISDDEERTKKVRRCAKSTLQRLVTAVVPLLPAINQYLSGFGDNPPETVCAWGDLCQAALEARTVLEEAKTAGTA